MLQYIYIYIIYIYNIYININIGRHGRGSEDGVGLPFWEVSYFLMMASWFCSQGVWSQAAFDAASCQSLIVLSPLLDSEGILLRMVLEISRPVAGPLNSKDSSVTHVTWHFCRRKRSS